MAVEVDAPAAAMVQGSRVQLRRALANLLDNARRHARQTVRVSVHERDGRVRVLVDDDGSGIPEVDQERVFERFVRLDEHRSRGAGGAGGAGLGLSLVRRIAERHHGTASVATVTPRGRSPGARPPRRATREQLARPAQKRKTSHSCGAGRSDDVMDGRAGVDGQLGHHRRRGRLAVRRAVDVHAHRPPVRASLVGREVGPEGACGHRLLGQDGPRRVQPRVDQQLHGLARVPVLGVERGDGRAVRRRAGVR